MILLGGHIHKMDWLKKNIGLLITIGGWIFSIGIYYNEISQLQKEVQTIKNRQSTFETTVNDMNKTITAIDTKMNLLLENKLIIAKNNPQKE